MQIRGIITAKDRPNYLTMLLATLEHAIKRHPIFIDLHEYGRDTDRDDIQQILSRFDNIQILKHESQHDVDKDVMNAIDISTRNTDYIITLDADSVVHPDIFKAVTKMILALPNMAIGTVFNTPYHPIVKKLDDHYGMKEWIGGLGVVLPTKTWNWYKSLPREIPGHWDWDISEELQKQRKPIYSTIRSYIEHMGYKGSHGGSARAANFME